MKKAGVQLQIRKEIKNSTETAEKKIEEHVNKFVELVDDDTKTMMKTRVNRLMEPGKGILAMDESQEELVSRLEAVGLPNTPANRLSYFLALIGEGVELRPFVSGILFSESSFSLLCDRGKKKPVLRKLINYGIAVGIRITKEQVPLHGTVGEVTASGIDTLTSDCIRFKEMGVSFTQMNCTFTIGEDTPSVLSYSSSAYTLARFASICQSTGLVPILSLDVKDVRPSHPTNETKSLSQHRTITEDLLSFLVKALADNNIQLTGTLLRISPFLSSTVESKSVAMSTLAAIVNRVPPAMGGVLLADSSSLSESAAILNAINGHMSRKPCPVSFAWGTVIKQAITDDWNKRGQVKDRTVNAVAERIKTSSLASMGQLPRDQRFHFITNVSET